MGHPYFIVAPAYDHTSAGIRCIHYLCHKLNEIGQEAYVSTAVINPKWNTPTARRKNINDCIVVYPEVTPGNPFNAKNVIRYVMQTPGLLGGDKEFPDSELVVYHSRQLSETGPYLTTPSIESDIFRPFPKYRRSGSVYYASGKSKNKPTPDQVEGMTQITREWPTTREEIADLFKRAEVFYTWDAMTALIQEATFCGCPVVIMDAGYWTKEDINKCEYGMAGVAWGVEELDRARKTCHEALANYAKLEKQFEIDLKALVKMSQERFVSGGPKHVFRDKLRVSCFMDNKDNGSNYYRAVLPLTIMAKTDPDIEVAFIRNGDTEKAVSKGFDTDMFFLPRIANPATLKAFESLSIAPVACDYDDNMFAVSPLSPHYHGLGTENIYIKADSGELLPVWVDGKNFSIKENKATLAKIAQCITDAKAISVTTDLLADAYRGLNANIHVLPNLVDLTLWNRLPLDNNGTVRLFWAGGISHYEDWYILKDVLPKVMQRYPQTRLVLMGVKWDATLKGIPEDRIEFHPWVHSEAYPYKVAILNPDISLIPLRDTVFSKGKSPIKFLEMGALNVPSVMSCISPYKEVMTEDNGVFIEDNNPEAWEEGISLLIENETVRKEMGIAARKYVEDNFDVHKEYVKYAKFFKEVA
jgi:glycosyltransferase involved in cell wall biosynthesis